MEPRGLDTRTCARCGGALDGADPGSLCSACAISVAEDAVESRRQDSALKVAKRARERASWKVPVPLLVAICIVCVGLVVWRAPVFVEAVSAQPSARIGTYTSAGQCDVCVARLWSYSEAMSFGDPIPELTCPASGEPYVVTGTAQDGTLEVRCPTPEAHDLSSLGVAWDRRMPEARR